MQIALKTLQAIETALELDQGATYRRHLGELMPQAGDAYDSKNEPYRTHLGASIIGRECPREVWYSFRWTTRKNFSGRMLRLFNRGHLEEPRFVALLKTIGCSVWQHDDDGKQFRIKGHRGHFGGSLDAVIQGLPDIPNEPVLGEFKTHNDKSFAKLVAEGVLKAKWEHLVQMQLYMGENNLNWAVYGAANKNDDSLHFELVQFDPAIFKRYKDRAAMIIDSNTPPPKINESPGWFKCKFCDHSPVCHSSALPDRNCRTCSKSRILDDGKWQCTDPLASKCGDSDILPKEDQWTKCDFYDLNPVFKNSK